MKKQDDEKGSSAIPARRSFLNILWLSLGFYCPGRVHHRCLRTVPAAGQIESASGKIRYHRHRRCPRSIHTEFGDCLCPRAILSCTAGRRRFSGTLPQMHPFRLHGSLEWQIQKGRFICPCHGSSFDITGNVISPPAPRALDMYPVIIENDIVKVRYRQPEGLEKR